MKAKHTKAKKKKLFSFRTVILIFVATILGFSLYNWNAEKITGNKMPMPFGYGASIVLSGSMEPALSVNDLVIVKETDNIKEKDIVVFQNGNSLVIHRVVSVDGDTITTKGDANNTADNPISKSSIKGVMICNIPYVGLVVNFLKQPVVVVILLAGAIFLIERSFGKQKNKDTDELSKIMEEIKKLKQSQN